MASAFAHPADPPAAGAGTTGGQPSGRARPGGGGRLRPAPGYEELRRQARAAGATLSPILDRTRSGRGFARVEPDELQRVSDRLEALLAARRAPEGEEQPAAEVDRTT